MLHRETIELYMTKLVLKQLTCRLYHSSVLAYKIVGERP